MIDPNNDNERLVLKFFTELSAKNFDALKALMTSDVSWTPMLTDSPLGKSYLGDEIFDVFLVPILDIYAPGDPKYDVTSLVSVGELAFAEAHGYGDVGSKGRSYSNRYAWAFEIEDGKIKAIREYFDTAYAIKTLLE